MGPHHPPGLLHHPMGLTPHLRSVLLPPHVSTRPLCHPRFEDGANVGWRNGLLETSSGGCSSRRTGGSGCR